LISKTLGLSDLEVEVIIKAAMLHDIGKIGIRDSVLQKEGKLTDEEYEHIKKHVEITHDILSKINLSEAFKDIVEIASTHHEKYNGTGYYKKISGEDIPLGGRILAVADVFDAITSKDFKEQIIIPNSNVVNRFDSIIKPIFDSILNLGFQNLRLATLRDTLLPKLMSGQIKL
jgi:HD-GYP domain-containing protein (c-di-GMP phosphodiesterase class II)